MTRLLASAATAALTAAVFGTNYACAFYVPGVQPQSFQVNDEVTMKVNSMTSVHTQVPKDYYRLPFCEPPDGPKMVSENLGEFLAGNKIQSSPYVINMLHETFCQIVCQVQLDTLSSKNLKMHVKYGYHNNWIIDNLPSASVGLSKETGEKQRHYAGGFPIGFIAPKPGAAPPTEKKGEKFTANKQFFETQDAFVYNHVNINIDYHPPYPEDPGYRVVGFAVEPMSIKHHYLNEYQWDGTSAEGFTRPLQTCPPTGRHMSRGDVHENQIINPGETVLYTYDVIWHESPIEWASRWDVYLSEDHMVPAQVHWYAITNSILVVLFLSILVTSVLVRNLRRDIAGYNKAVMTPLTDEEKDEEMDESGWKLIHADVFRAPTTHPMLFCVSVGSGVQICIAGFVSIIFSAVGFLSPAWRGSLLTAILVLYVLCGSFSGYVSSRLYKCFRGRQWQLCTLITAVFFPGICFGLFLFFNIILAFFHSSGSVPFLDVLILAAMWCCVSVPLVFLGAYFGYKKDVITFPTVTSTIARAIPPTSFFLNPRVAMASAGMVPFAAAYVELFFIMTSLWMDQFYYVFGFTLIVFLILILTCAEVTILLCYYQLCAENHRWWWFSFVTSGSTGFYLFAYSIFWFQQLEASKMVITYMLYFGYMFLISMAVFLTTGMVGFISCFFFVRKIFSTIKVD